MSCNENLLWIMRKGLMQRMGVYAHSHSMQSFPKGRLEHLSNVFLLHSQVRSPHFGFMVASPHIPLILSNSVPRKVKNKPFPWAISFSHITCLPCVEELNSVIGDAESERLRPLCGLDPKTALPRLPMPKALLHLRTARDLQVPALRPGVHIRGWCEGVAKYALINKEL